MKTQLARGHQRTYDAILKHPAPHNLQWRDVRALLLAMADVSIESNGNMKATLDGRTVVVRVGNEKDVGEGDELRALRSFLEQSVTSRTPPRARGENYLVVIDHREARVYRTEFRGAAPERIVPLDRGQAGRYLHYVQDDSNGQRRPELRSFYQAVAASLEDADAILIFGGGTGASSAMDQLVHELKDHHPALAERIIGAVVVDEHHQTEGQLLAKARAYYAEGEPVRVPA